MIGQLFDTLNYLRRYCRSRYLAPISNATLLCLKSKSYAMAHRAIFERNISLRQHIGFWKRFKNLPHCCPNLHFCVKPWPDGDASWRKLKAWVNLQLRLARACVHLRWLAMTCAHFGRDQICTQVDTSFSPLGHPTQVNASWLTSINLLLANKIQDSLP